MIEDDELRELHAITKLGGAKPNPAVKYGKGTEIEDCACEESCNCDPCPCDECKKCGFDLCCCCCDSSEEDEDEDDDYDGAEEE